MSLHDYEVSRQIEAMDAPFGAILMAAMRRADSMNAAVLRRSYPNTFAELQARYEAPQGLLPGERNPATGDRMMPDGTLVDSEANVLREGGTAMVTESGRVLTDEDVERLAEEAEQGHPALRGDDDGEDQAGR